MPHHAHDTQTLSGWKHADANGAVHSGKYNHCERCRLEVWRKKRAIAEYAETQRALARMTPGEAETVRRVNALLNESKAKPAAIAFDSVMLGFAIGAFVAFGVIAVLQHFVQ